MATISDLYNAQIFNELVAKSNQKKKVHLKIETGMGRLGIKLQK